MRWRRLDHSHKGLARPPAERRARRRPWARPAGGPPSPPASCMHTLPRSFLLQLSCTRYSSEAIKHAIQHAGHARPMAALTIQPSSSCATAAVLHLIRPSAAALPAELHDYSCATAVFSPPFAALSSSATTRARSRAASRELRLKGGETGGQVWVHGDTQCVQQQQKHC